MLLTVCDELLSFVKLQPTVFPSRLNPPIESAAQGSAGGFVAVGAIVGAGGLVLVGAGGSSVSVGGGAEVGELVGELLGEAGGLGVDEGTMPTPVGDGSKLLVPAGFFVGDALGKSVLPGKPVVAVMVPTCVEEKTVIVPVISRVPPAPDAACVPGVLCNASIVAATAVSTAPSPCGSSPDWLAMSASRTSAVC
jgi:hypothetical protein